MSAYIDTASDVMAEWKDKMAASATSSQRQFTVSPHSPIYGMIWWCLNVSEARGRAMN
jgi:hypothetical protein